MSAIRGRTSRASLVQQRPALDLLDALGRTRAAVTGSVYPSDTRRSRRARGHGRAVTSGGRAAVRPWVAVALVRDRAACSRRPSSDSTSWAVSHRGPRWRARSISCSVPPCHESTGRRRHAEGYAAGHYPVRASRVLTDHGSRTRWPYVATGQTDEGVRQGIDRATPRRRRARGVGRYLAFRHVEGRVAVFVAKARQRSSTEALSPRLAAHRARTRADACHHESAHAGPERRRVRVASTGASSA